MIKRKTIVNIYQRLARFSADKQALLVPMRSVSAPGQRGHVPPASTQAGQAMLMAIIFFLAGSLIIIISITTPVIKEIQAVQNLLNSKQSFFFSEGAMEDAVYRLSQNLPLSSPEVLLFSGGHATTTHVATGDGGEEITSEGNRDDRIRIHQVSLIEGLGTSFTFGVQSGEGGVFMEGPSSILGNVYSNGPIQGTGSSLIDGDVISAGPAGFVADVHATGTVWSHTINDSIVDRDAHYQVISNTTVGGNQYPGKPDQPQAPLPIPDSWIALWESDAEAGGVIASTDPDCSSGTYSIDSDTTLGPIKIECDFEIRGNPDITFAGAVWVVGDITFKNNPTIYVEASLVGKSIPIIADNLSDRETSSRITLENADGFVGAGAFSFILLISQNSSSENGGSELAIDVHNSAQGDLLLYAGHGEIKMKNNTSLREVTAFKIHLQNSAQVIYDTGLASTLFTAGPSGGFSIDGWGESE